MNPKRCSIAWVGLLVVCLAALLRPDSASAQFQQYTPPGDFNETRESTQELLERAIEEARWRAGRFYFDPWLAIRDVAYVDPAIYLPDGETASDFTASLGAGIRGYRPIGPELTFAIHALPEYVWWLDLADRRRINGSYGAGLFGNLGRTGIEVTANRLDDAVFFSRELEVPVNTRFDRGALELEVDVVGGFSLFGGGELRLIRYLDNDDPELEDLDLLDRDETIFRAGFRFRPVGGLAVGIGAESSQVDFEDTRGDRSNEGISPILQLDFDGTVFFFDALLAYRDLEPTGDSVFIPYQAVTGKFQASVRPGIRVEPQLFGSRNLVYSIDQQWAYFVDTGLGVGLRTSLSRWGSFRVFVEKGTNDYYAIATGDVDRVDDYTAFGGDFRFDLGRATLRLGATYTDYESNFPEGVRDVLVIRTGVDFGRGGTSEWF